jgi:hypothetical protein
MPSRSSFLAAEQRDAFAVLAHAGQRVAEVGLGLVLVFGDLHEARPITGSSRAQSRRRASAAITRKPGMVICEPPSVTVQRAADGPEHDDEGRCRKKRRVTPR